MDSPLLSRNVKESYKRDAFLSLSLSLSLGYLQDVFGLFLVPSVAWNGYKSEGERTMMMENGWCGIFRRYLRRGAVMDGWMDG